MMGSIGNDSSTCIAAAQMEEEEEEEEEECSDAISVNPEFADEDDDNVDP